MRLQAIPATIATIATPYCHAIRRQKVGCSSAIASGLGEWWMVSAIGKTR
jgi:hypothetical protein